MMDNQHVRQHYPLQGLKGLYCRGVLIERDAKLVAHDPYEISLVTVPAVVNPGPNNPLTAGKVKRILDIAADNAHKDLVLGAWGCGVFRNDPEEIARLFKLLLATDFDGVFENVVFAVPGKTSHNYQMFESVLNESN
jgi:uncharacterized protein (TIGR02452 family)